ncbi:hypothetical protein GCM10009550_73470 [Actinocorallia libanotica]|uniref:Uncharacterized protein n=1 Tax=Actinocorallia libanotica TaxID=46162 RepID=A0ABN1RZZ2_9ACTN
MDPEPGTLSPMAADGGLRPQPSGWLAVDPVGDEGGAEGAGGTAGESQECDPAELAGCPDGLLAELNGINPSEESNRA